MKELLARYKNSVTNLKKKKKAVPPWVSARGKFAKADGNATNRYTRMR